MSPVRLIGVGEPGPRLEEERNSLAGRASLEGLEDSLVERYQQFLVRHRLSSFADVGRPRPL